MKKAVLVIALLMVGIGMIHPAIAAAYNYGDFRSATLATKAWEALAAKDLEAVLAYTNKCIELYAEQAKKMQASLEDYPAGTNEEIFAYWALNDVATCLFIQGEAYRQEDMKDEALAAYQKVVDDYAYGQTWDVKGWFWKPAEAAQEKIAMLESGSTLDFGDYSSSYLAGKAWGALSSDDTAGVVAYTDKILELYAEKAKAMQESMTEYAWESKDAIFAQWALNDVGTALYIRAEAFKRAGDLAKAKEAYQSLVSDYFYAQCWDPNGWFWKPAEAAQQSLDEIGDI
ncbi:MAG TPA: tetratricopeptide repeat protein [Candidatus Omnitrophota bacterium]|nr:tetratricopeptide repeat protein [Candidatus Omnitrophota bacterium]